jgi:hypothetical protein
MSFLSDSELHQQRIIHASESALTCDGRRCPALGARVAMCACSSPRLIGAPILHAAVPAARRGANRSELQQIPMGTPPATRLVQSEKPMKKSIKKLTVNLQTIRTLATDDLAQAAGGWIRPPITWSCPQP